MQKVSLLSIASLFIFVMIAAAKPALAFDGCRAADVTGDGGVDIFDVLAILDAQGTSSPRLDLDGSGIVDAADVSMALGLFSLGPTCTDCTADLNGDGDVDAQDRSVLEAAYGRECRLDLDRSDLVDDENDVDIWVLYFGSLPSPAKTRADFDGNGVVNINDLFLVLPSVGNDCRPDLNKDGAVDTNDLWALLASWGPCP